jgi:hypothetical protein
MKIRFALLIAVAGCSSEASAIDPNALRDPGATIDDRAPVDEAPSDGESEPAGARVLHAKGHADKGASASSDMTWHGGAVLHATVTGAVFWGSSWSPTNAKVTGMDGFFGGFGGSDYAATSDEYTDGSGAVTSSVTYLGHVIDGSRASSRASRSVSTVVNEACRAFPHAVSNGFYAVYTDIPRGYSGFCAWHSYGRCGNGAHIQVAFFYDLDGDPGCDPGSTVQGVSQGLAAIANVTAHELSEARTDPHLDAWYDASGNENGDKCAWTFGPTPVTFSNGTQWKLQGEWSNAANDKGTGYYQGCIQTP